MGACACCPSTQELEVGGSLGTRSFEMRLSNIVRPHFNDDNKILLQLLIKYENIARHADTPVIPAI